MPVTVKPSVLPRQDLIEWEVISEEVFEEADQYRAFLKYLSQDFEVFPEKLLQEYPAVMNALLINIYLQDVYNEIALTENELIAFYNDNPEIFTEESSFELVAVFTEDRQQALKVLQEVQDDKELISIVEKEKPDIQKFLDGRYTLHELPHFLEGVVQTLEAGETSGLYQTEEGFYIIHLISRQEGKLEPFENVKSDIQRMISRRKMVQHISEVMKGGENQ